MRKNYSFLLYTLLIFSIAGCKKYSFEDNGLPATTTKGAHTFGALIENKPWVSGKNAGIGLQVFPGTKK
jgi:hypothetical protein